MNENENNFDAEVSSGENVSNKKYKKMDIVALILCLIVAMSIWVYVMNVNRSVVDKTITLSVDIRGQIEDATDGMTIISDNNTIDGVSIDYSQMTVKVTVSGMQSELDKYKDSDYSVKVDVSDIGSAGVYALSFTCITPSPSITLTSVTPSLTGYVLIDKPATRTLTKITATYDGSFLTDSTITVFPQSNSSLVISGPESRIEAIDRAEVVVTLASGDKSALRTSGNIRFYDANGNEIKSLGYISIEPSMVTVDVKIEAHRVFPITLKNNVIEKDGYRYTVKLLGELTELLLFGDTADMDSVEVTLDLAERMKDIYSGAGGELSAELIAIPDGFVLETEIAGKTLSYYVEKIPLILDPTVPDETEAENTTGGEPGSSESVS